ncbi:MAG: hypothetical protein ABR867_03070 [Nitrososphaerales archaeon]|jgi:hypothetical protein
MSTVWKDGAKPKGVIRFSDSREIPTAAEPVSPAGHDLVGNRHAAVQRALVGRTSKSRSTTVLESFGTCRVSEPPLHARCRWAKRQGRQTLTVVVVVLAVVVPMLTVAVPTLSVVASSLSHRGVFAGTSPPTLA